MKLLDKVKLLCDEHGETLASLERKMDFGNGTIRRWENTIPSGDRLAKVADFFQVSVDNLLGREDVTKEVIEQSPAFFRLKKGLEPYDLTDDDTDFLLTVYKAHIEKNSKG